MRAVTVIFLAAVSLLKLGQYFSLQTQAYDLGIYANVVWNTAFGSFFKDSIKGVNYLGDHFSPGLILLAPLFWVCKSAAALLIVQSAALALTIPAVYRLAERVLADKRLALGFAVWLALFPYVHKVSASDFHAVALAVPLLAWALYFWEAGRKKEMLACLAAAMLFQEDVALVAAGIGGYIALSARDRASFRLGLALGGACLAVFALELFVLMPFFGGSWRPGHWGFYAELGRTPFEMFAALASPSTWWAVVANPEKMKSLLRLFGYSAGLCLLAPRAMVMVLVPLTYNILSSRSAQYEFDAHYSATLLPALFFAMIHGYKRVAARAPAFAILALMPLVGAWHWPRYFHAPGLKRYRAAREAFRMIPPGQAVQASMNLVPHLCLRGDISVLPGPRPASWVVLDLEQVGWEMPQSYKKGAKAFSIRHKEKRIFEKAGLEVFNLAAGAR